MAKISDYIEKKATDMPSDKWAIGGMNIAKTVAESFSKDPSTQVGAYIYEANTKRPVSIGYNGFPFNMVDDEEKLNNREEKLKNTLHAEHNAILFADLDIDKKYVLCTYPLFPCYNCSLVIMQSGIDFVFSFDEVNERWAESCSEAAMALLNAGVGIYLMDSEMKSGKFYFGSFQRLSQLKT